MTQQERNEHRNRLRGLRTAEERERFRLEHHERMVLRARERGVELPPAPPAQAGRAQQGGVLGAGPRPGPSGAGGGRGR